MIHWKRSTGDFVESHCGRWSIAPIYGGLTRPESYVLYRDGKVVGSGSTQREAKDTAAQLSERRGIDPRETICTWPIDGCTPSKQVLPCNRLDCPHCRPGRTS